MKKIWRIGTIVCVVLFSMGMIMNTKQINNASATNHYAVAPSIEMVADSSVDSMSAPSAKMGFVKTDNSQMGARKFLTNDGQANLDRKIIKTGSLSIISKLNLTEVVTSISSLASNYQGYVTESYTASYNANINVMVPSESLEVFLTSVEKLGHEVTDKRITGRDVTEEFVDVTTRRKTLEATNEQLLLLMKEAKTVQDVLSVQRELTQNTEQLEIAKARLEYLSKNVAMSMVSVSISKYVSYDGPKQDTWSPWRSVKEALGSAIFFIILSDILIFSMVFCVPLCTIGFLGFLCCRRLNCHPRLVGLFQKYLMTHDV